MLAEHDAGGADWYQPAFDVLQETALTATQADFACTPGRGDAANPLFLLNHWLPRRPALPSDALEVNAADVLLERARRCAADRGHVPNIVAVDFYDAGDLFTSVDALNGLPGEDEAPTATASPASPSN